MITLKSDSQIALMRKAGKVVAEMLERCREASKPGVTTIDIDAIARQVLKDHNAKSNFLHYHGFPAVICTSPNNVVVHGIPDGYVLQEGDILSLDCGAIIEGWHADAAVTVPVGEIDKDSKRLLEITERSLFAAIDQVKDGNRLGDLGDALEQVAIAGGLGIVRDYVGHGIGTAMHEDPQIPNYGPPHKGPKLKVGMVIAIEPMLNLGGEDTHVLDDDWSVVTADGSRSAHFEHTIALTANGPEILTLP